MLFNSWGFVVLVCITFILYYASFLAKFQVQILILSSLCFYAYGAPSLLFLLLFSASINIFTTRQIAGGKVSMRRFWATLGVLVNLLILSIFKYSPLFASTFLDLKSDIGKFIVNIPLPIGISFYTFEGISLLVDVYSNKHTEAFSFGGTLKDQAYKTLFFISFFPHLIAGPILKAYQFYPQIGRKELKDIDWNYVVRYLILGYFFKMVVADNLSNFTFWMTYPHFKIDGSITLIAMLYGYSFQIFADFAGYSLIALGLAQMFGYRLPENFNFPYISRSFSEFWQRWHISLSTFLKEYLYIPLGGNRKGKIRTYFNLFITMVLGGLWHGAAWSYAVWGAFHGLALAGERMIRRRVSGKFVIPGAVKVFFVFSFVTLAWLLFRLPWNHAVEYLRAIKTNIHLEDQKTLIFCLVVYSLPVILFHLVYSFHSMLDKNAGFYRLKPVLYGVLLFLIIVNSGPTGTFIYFQF